MARSDCPGHQGWVDDDGILVHPPRRYDWLRAAIRRVHPRCDLTFDRENGLYAIVREDKDLYPLGDVDAGGKLWHIKSFFTPLLHLCWNVHRPGHTTPKKVYREPGEWVLKRVGEFRRKDFDYDQFQYLCDSITEQSMKQDEKWKRDINEVSTAVVDEFRKTAGKVSA